MLVGDDPLLVDHHSEFPEQHEKMQRFILSDKLLFAIFFPLGFFCIFIGTYLTKTKTPLYEVSKDYTNICIFGSICEIPVEIKNRMKFPIAIMYQLTNFYQNHLKSISSRSDAQLLGKYVSFDGMKKCFPYRSINDDPERSKWILPCGLESISFFNDTFEIEDWEIQSTDLQQTGIVVRPLNQLYKGNPWPWSSADAHHRFSMWMDTAAFPNFKKLYGIAKSNKEYLEPGNLSIYAMNYYNTSAFDGTKSVILASVGDSPFAIKYLSFAFIVFGGVLILTAVAIFLFRPKSNISPARQLSSR